MRLKKSWKLILALGAGILLYAPSLFNYFSTDDWFLLRISELSSLTKFFEFFSFSRNEVSAAFYRPLPQQVFLGVFQKIAGINPLPYHLFVISCFAVSGYLVYKLARELHINEQGSIISMIIYMITAANFPRIYFISAFQDVLWPLFGLASIWAHHKNKQIWALVFLLLSLASKESAATLLGLWFLWDWYQRKLRWKEYVVPGVITLGYLYLRLRYFGNAQGDSYTWDFSLKKAANTIMWYGWWALGAPEILVDYVGSGLKFLPKYFTELGGFSYGLIGGLIGTLTATFFASIRRLKEKEVFRVVVFGIGFFLISLLSVVFLPWHKFAHHLGMPMAGIAWAVAMIISNSKVWASLWLSLFLVLNLQSNYLLWQRHYSVTRAKISQKAADYFKKNYPAAPNAPILFVNDGQSGSNAWGESKQVYYSLSGSEFFKVFYKKNDIRVYYEDLDKKIPDKVTVVGSKQFL